MNVAAWDWWSVALKALSLMAMAAAIGGSFVLQLARRNHCWNLSAISNYARCCAVVGMVAVILHFLVQVGAVNASGFAGMFDPLMAKILLQSSLGKVLALRLFGLLLIALSLRERQNFVGLLSCITGILMLCSSFLLTGHVSALALDAQLLLALHVFATLLWMGSLYPLLHLCREPELARLRGVMVNFGKLAVFIVAMLLLSGLYLLTNLLQTTEELWTTAYGATLLAKLSSVSVLLALGAMNKLVLVPRLTADAARTALQRSIRTEILLGAAVLVITGWLTTLVGPAHMI